jgi:tRNA G18 (ribose-2'-O)-methylase SpoU
MRSERRQIAGFERISAAFSAAEPVQALLVDRDDRSDRTRTLVEQARAAGAAIWNGSAGDLRRMSRGSSAEAVIAMLGATPQVDLDGLFGRGGAIWLLHHAMYPSNVGFAIRTAEVAGAQGVVVDAGFNHEQRARACHVSMGAHRVLPVLWESSAAALATARSHGHRVVALEDSGQCAPWELDLTRPTLFVVGNERDGIAQQVLDACDAVTALPMAGFVPSYNLHAAIAAIACERLRQLATLTGADRIADVTARKTTHRGG